MTKWPFLTVHCGTRVSVVVLAYSLEDAVRVMRDYGQPFTVLTYCTVG